MSTTATAAGTVRLTALIPSSLRAGSPVEISGHTSYAPGRLRAVLERKTAAGWSAIGQAPLHRDAFRLTWRPVSASFLTLRVVIRDDRGRDLVSSPVQQVLVGAAPVYCAPPTPPADVPAGDGWITGGLYIAGGPAPGVYECVDRPYTITVTDQTGQDVATQEVVAGQSYTFVLPAGSYNLSSMSSGSCTGSATVNAGKQTQTDTVCAVP